MMTPTEPRKSGVILASPLTTLGESLDQMAAANVGSILIVEANRIVGILTERDLLKHWRSLSDKNYALTPVRDVMTKPVFTLNIRDLADAPQAMLARRIRHVPLIADDGQLVGMMSMRDVLAAQLRSGTLPRLTVTKATPPPTADQPQRTLHLLTPTAQLAQICRSYLPEHWQCRVWLSPKELEQKTDTLRHDAFMLDLDGLGEGDDWRSLVKHFISLLTEKQQAPIFLVSSPTRFQTKDIKSLQSVAAKAKWHVYQRPLPVTELIHDLADLGAAAP